MSWIQIALLGSIFIASFLGFQVLLSSKNSHFLKTLSLNLFMIGCFSFIEYELHSVDTLERVLPLIPWYDTLLMAVMFCFTLTAVVFAHDTKSLPRSFFMIFLSGATVYFLILLYGRWVLDIPFRHGITTVDGTWNYKLYKEGYFQLAFLSWFVVLDILANFGVFWSFFYTPFRIDRKLKGIIVFFCLTFGIVLIFFLIFLVGPDDQLPFTISLSLSISYIPLYLIFIAVRKHRLGLQHIPPYVMDTIPNPVLVLDNQLQVRFYNQRVPQVVGEALASTFKGQSLRNVATVMGVSNKELDAFKEEIFNLKPGQQFERYLPIESSGDKRLFFISITPIFWMNSTVFGYILLGTDLTNTQHNRKMLEEKAQALKRSNQELSRFAQVASSDLKTPVRNIINFTKLIERKNKSLADKTIQEYLHFIDKNAKMMYQLIEDILRFSSINQFEPEQVDLNLVAAKISDLLHEESQQLNAQLHFAPLPVITSNQSLMVLLFKNLLENGLKYNDKSTPMLLVEYHEKDGHHQLIFRDNGLGIDAIYQEQIFQIFKRLHTPDQYSGTGVGLAICKKIVDLHNGSIKVRSTPGMGSDFIVLLPKIQEEQIAEAATSNAHTPA